jgi:hypothetical protein
VFEDGTITYEFLYRDGESHVHPALDRLALLLDPPGIRIHWITDGRYDATPLAPDNVTDEPGNRRGPQPLPLRPNAWNQVALTVKGDDVLLSLNGQLVYERRLESTNQRTFGLFHFADQTEARVRNVVWRGTWPRQLPPVAQQELADVAALRLDERVAELPAEFEHDFSAQGLPANRFSLIQGRLKENYRPEPDGMHMGGAGTAGYRDLAITPRLVIHGDFDIVATYDRFVAEAVRDGNASVYLKAILGEERTECMVIRRQSIPKAGREQQFHQTAVVRYDGGNAIRNFARPSTSETLGGRLRLARRGEMIHFLMAEGDSPNYWLLRSEKVARGDVLENGLRLMTQTHREGRVGVVWKSLSIRAEQLDGQAVENDSQLIVQLNRQRVALPVKFAHDFRRTDVTPQQFLAWGFQPSSSSVMHGLRVAGPPTDNWTSAGLAPQIPLRGDFDVSFEFDVIQITEPKAGMNSAVYLQLDVPVERQHQYNVFLVRNPGEGLAAVAQMRRPAASGNGFEYRRLAGELVEQVQRLRLARRGNTLYFLYAADAAQPDRLLARHEVEAMDLPAGAIRLMVHAGGAGRIADTAWKKVTVHSR